MGKMKVLQTITVEGKEFKVVKFTKQEEIWYGTVDVEYIKNNRLTQQLNGIEMLINKSREDAITSRQQQPEIERKLKELYPNIF